MTTDTSKRPSRFWLYLPFFFFALLITAYSAYWFWMRGELGKGVDAWIADQRAAGNVIEYADKKLTGFPYRFALTVDEPRFADRSNGVDWTGQELQLIMQPWNFYHVIGRSPGRNSFDLRGEEPITAILGSRSVASLSWTDTGIERFAVALDTADIVLTDGAASLQDFSLNFGAPDEDSSTMRLAVDIGEMSLPYVPDEIDWLGRAIGELRLRVEVRNFGVFLNRTNPFLPDPVADSSLQLAQFLVSWGPLKLGAKGDIQLSAQSCTPDGTLSVRLEETDALLVALSNANQLTEEIETGIKAVGNVSKNGGFAPITFKDGNVTFLGQAVAPLPQYCRTAESIGAN